jgi:hypothetical protein
VSIALKSGKKVTPADEVFVNYGASFWATMHKKTDQHCNMCFGKSSTQQNPLVRCVRNDCCVSRHLLCLPAPRPSLEDLRRPTVRHYCADHLQLSEPGASIASRPSSAVPVASIASRPSSAAPVASFLAAESDTRRGSYRGPAMDLGLTPLSKPRPAAAPPAVREKPSRLLVFTPLSKAPPPQVKAKIAPAVQQTPPEVQAKVASARSFLVFTPLGPARPPAARPIQATSSALSSAEVRMPLVFTPMGKTTSQSSTGVGRRASTAAAAPAVGVAAVPHHHPQSLLTASELHCRNAGLLPRSLDALLDRCSRVAGPPASASLNLGHRIHSLLGAAAEQSVSSAAGAVAVQRIHLRAPVIPPTSTVARSSTAEPQVEDGGPGVDQEFDGDSDSEEEHIEDDESQYSAVGSSSYSDATSSARARGVLFASTSGALGRRSYSSILLGTTHTGVDPRSKLPVRKAKALLQLPGYDPMPLSDKQLKAANDAMSAASLAHPTHAHLRPQISDAKSVAAASGSVASRQQQSRWCNMATLPYDFAEYKACCGVPATVERQLAAQGKVASLAHHSCMSPLSLLQERLSHRARCSSKKEWDESVRTAIAQAGHSKGVRWHGCAVCMSCFRAVLGLARSTFFKKVELPSSVERRPKTAADQKVSTTAALVLDFCAKAGGGQSNPNHRSDNVNLKRYILPWQRMDDAWRGLREWDNCRRGDASLQFSASTLRRAIKALKQDNVSISVAQSKELCRCNNCEEIHNSIRDAKERKDPADEAFHRAQLAKHLNAMLKQRKHLEKLKNKAISTPDEHFCILLDGMDQAKTQLPSRPRMSKMQDAAARLKVHVIGAFCFGGPVLLSGLTNFPDVKKDGALSVTALERILDLQFEALEAAHAAAATVAPAAAAANSAAGAEPGSASSAGKRVGHQGVGLKWPRQLHVSFDNATGDCKNQWVFRFLGALVHTGVFDAITVVTLLVGHTHDIVDQMFSVWSRMLRLLAAETYEKMVALFQEKYHTRIEGVLALMRNQREEAIKAGIPPDVADEIIEANSKMQWNLNGSANEWMPASEKDVATLQAHMEELAAVSRNLRPRVVEQPFSIHVEGWLAANIPDSTSAARRLTHLDVPHNFGIEKCMDESSDDFGNTYLYSSYMADSTTSAEYLDSGAQHQWPHQQTGSYSTRSLLMTKDEHIASDPLQRPPLAIDTEPLRATVADFQQQKAMTADEAEQFIDRLDYFDHAQEELEHVCSTCWDHVQSVVQIGTVSRKKDASVAEQAEANRKGRSRSVAVSGMRKHLADTSDTVKSKHEQLKCHGWWTKWMRRVQRHIQPGYIARGWVTDPALRALPYHIHPRHLVTGRGEAALMDEDTRVDFSCLQRNGYPKVGQLVVARGSEIRQPIWIGKIVGLQAQPTHSSSAAAAGPGGSESAAAASPADPGERHEREPNGPRTFGRVSARARHLPAALDLDELHTRQYMVEWWLLLQSSSDVIRPYDDEHWRKQFDEHGTTEQQASEDLARAEHHPPAIPWIVDLYREALYHPVRRSDACLASGASLILWGHQKDILRTQAQGLKMSVWRRVRQDLTEQTPSDATSARDAARSAGAVRPRSGAVVAAAASAAARPRGKRRRVASSSSESECTSPDDSEAELSRWRADGAATASARATVRNRRPRLQRVSAQKHAGPGAYEDESLDDAMDTSDRQAKMQAAPAAAAASSRTAAAAEVAAAVYVPLAAAASSAHTTRKRQRPGAVAAAGSPVAVAPPDPADDDDAPLSSLAPPAPPRSRPGPAAVAAAPAAQPAPAATGTKTARAAAPAAKRARPTAAHDS